MSLLKIGFLSLFVFVLAGCQGGLPADQESPKVGLLVPETINDQVWGTKGYRGLLSIQSKYDLDVYYKEDVESEAAIKQAVVEYASKGVTLLFGHGNQYTEVFNDIASTYPDIQFISFNGQATEVNTTSLQFEGRAMGFFGGMVAAAESETRRIGVLAAFDWQPEVTGFVEGAAYEAEDVEVFVEYVENWDDEEKALQQLDTLLAKQVDVVYPAGDGFNVPVIEELKERGLYVIGYVSDQSDLGEATVLTSTIQQVDQLYELVADKYLEGELEGGNPTFDFQDGVISLGAFSPNVGEEVRSRVEEEIQKFIDSGELPK